MMKKILFVFIALTFLTPYFGICQSDSTEIVRKHGFAAKKLFVDFLGPSGGDIADFRSYSDGFEIGYMHNFSGPLELYLPFRTAVVQFNDDLSPKRMHSIGAQIQYNLKSDDAVFQPYVLLGGNALFSVDSQTEVDLPIGLGLNIKVHPSTAINLQGAYHLSGENRSNMNLAMGVKYYFLQEKKIKPLVEEEEEEVKLDKEEELDTDGDGVANTYDLCPNEAGLAMFDGCPDQDGDGIPDHTDKCPDDAGPKIFGGCPDTDGDGVPDSSDECPNVPGSKENNGCPIIDSDGDGVPDGSDECKNEYGPSATNGCPDTDGDGVPDKDDKCIETPGPASNMGCPQIEKKEQETLDLAMVSVKFESNRATLKPSSFRNLNDIATIMKRYPSYKLRISGHTDNTGSVSLNQRLSEQRARSCYEYLASRGISASRMSYVGFGPDQPRADNDTESGRRLNRRVEFDLYLSE